jgi:hypothetical protein
MLSARRRSRLQRSLVLLSLCYAVYYVVIYRPLTQRAEVLNQPLQEVWRELAEVGPPGALDASMHSKLEQTREAAREALARLEVVQQAVAARLELDAFTRAAMAEPFQLIDFQNERQSRIEELTRKAVAAKVVVGPGVSSGFPEYLAEQPHPEWLWPQLLLAQHLVAGAIRSAVATVEVVRLPPVQVYRSGTNGNDWLTEISAEIELSGPAPAVDRFLEQLPLTAPEIQARGLPAAEASKPVIFIRGVVQRKERRDRSDQVKLELGSSMFVLPYRRLDGS